MDRFYRGFIAGSLGGVAMNIWSLFSYHFLHFTKLRYLDWASIFLYGHLPVSTLQAVYSLVIQLLWVGFLGVIFAFLIPAVTSRGYYGKGIIYGLTVGFIVYAIPKMFKMPELTVTTTATVLSSHIGGVIWGLTMAYVLRRLDTTALKK